MEDIKKLFLNEHGSVNHYYHNFTLNYQLLCPEFLTSFNISCLEFQTITELAYRCFTDHLIYTQNPDFLLAKIQIGKEEINCKFIMTSEQQYNNISNAFLLLENNLENIINLYINIRTNAGETYFDMYYHYKYDIQQHVIDLLNQHNII